MINLYESYAHLAPKECGLFCNFANYRKQFTYVHHVYVYTAITIVSLIFMNGQPVDRWTEISSQQSSDEITAPPSLNIAGNIVSINTRLHGNKICHSLKKIYFVLFNAVES